MTNNVKIEETFRKKYHGKTQLISNRMKDAYYESAHTGGSNGRFLYSSLIGNYVNNPKARHHTEISFCYLAF